MRSLISLAGCSPYLSSQDLKDVLIDPRHLVKALDRYIVGQEATKKALALMWLRKGLIGLQQGERLPQRPLFDKSNVLLVGDTGCGKTSIMRALQKVTGCAIGIEDLTGMTSSGYVGRDVNEILERYVEYCSEHIYENINMDEIFEEDDSNYTRSWKKRELLLTTIENGVIYLDEIDKIAGKDVNRRDITGDAVQNELLKFLENGDIPIKRNNHGIDSINTTNLTFVLGGAFQGLREIISKRLKQKSSIGFHGETIITDKDQILASLTTEDLIEYGFKPEFLGRIPLRTTLTALDKDMMRRIISEPENSIYSQYELVFEMFDIDFSMDDAAMNYVAEKALELNMGARSLKQIFTKMLEDALFNIYTLDSDFKIGLDYVKERL